MNYIKKNLEPILFGFIIGVFTMIIFNLIESIIIKIILILNKQKMAILVLNYAHSPKTNYLYIMNNDFIGFEEKLSKKEKEILNAKLIWKRKKEKK